MRNRTKRTQWLLTTVATMSLAPVAIRAQEPVQLEPAHDQMFNLIINRRARLGLKVSLQAQDSDSIGARVDAVTPGGPAAKAGIRSGDLITKLAGTSVLSGPDAIDEPGRSVPGLRLVEFAARLPPNDTIAVEFRRGADRNTVSLVTAGDPALLGGLRARPLPPGVRLPPDLEAMRGGAPDPEMESLDIRLPRMAMLFGGELSELEFAPLNADLGQYFGTTDGILVISAPKNSSLGLKGGDVVVAVDGRKAASPSHLLRILRSYDRGEAFKIDILRNRKRETVTAKRQ